jgi:pimeloyl-ACP methyl ester carboxylesterase
VGGDILALVERLDSGPAHLIGTSFAGAPAVWAAAENPELVRSLVLIGASVREAKTTPIMRALVWLMMNNPWRVRTWVMYYGTLFPTRKPDDFKLYLKQLAENMAQPGRFDAAAALAAASRQPSEQRLAEVKAPTLVVMGTKDPDFPDPAAEGRYIAEHTGGNLALIEGAGHYPQTEMPEKTAPVVLQFLKRAGSERDSLQRQRRRIDRG